MRIVKTTIWTAAIVGCAAAVGVGGCDRQAPVVVAAQPQEPPVQQQVQPIQPMLVTAQQQYEVLEQAPPAIRIEQRPSPPSADVIWIDGYWNWNHQAYSWEGGHYERPPQPNVVWVAPRYESEGRGVRFTRGQWSPGPGDGRNRGRGN